MSTTEQLQSLQGFNYEDVVLALIQLDTELIYYGDLDYFDIVTETGLVACMLDPLDCTFMVEAY